MGRTIRCRCNGDCLNCKYDDCLASARQIDYFERKERKENKITTKLQRKREREIKNYGELV